MKVPFGAKVAACVLFLTISATIWWSIESTCGVVLLRVLFGIGYGISLAGKSIAGSR